MKVTVHRKQRLRDWGPRYASLLDGEKVAKVFSGRSVTFEADPGRHTLQCKLEITSKSPEVEFVVGDQPLEFDCEPRLGTIASPIENLSDGEQHILLDQRS